MSCCWLSVFRLLCLVVCLLFCGLLIWMMCWFCFCRWLFVMLIILCMVLVWSRLFLRSSSCCVLVYC